MAKTKLTIELDDEIIAKIRELFNKYNDNPVFGSKFNDIESYISFVLTSQIKGADKMSEKLQENMKSLMEKLGDMGLNDLDLSKIFGDVNGSSSDKKEEDETKPDKDIKN